MRHFTIIVPVFQIASIFNMFIESLCKSLTRPCDLIFINDGSPIDIEPIVNKYKSTNNFIKNLNIIKNEKSMGCAKSLNNALEMISEISDFIVFMDSDLIVQNRWQNQLEESFYLENVGIVGGVLLYPQTGGIQCCGITYGESIGRHLFLNANPDVLNEMSIIEIQATVFAFCAIRYTAIKETGLLDDSFFNGYEDLDYQMRVRSLGFRTIINTNIRHYHWERSNGIHREFNRKNNLGRFWHKHGNNIVCDIWDFIFPQIKKISAEKKYIGIDICESRSDASFFWKELNSRSNITISKVYDYSGMCGDNQSIWLPQLFHSSGFTSTQPYLFFCDQFIRLLDNKYWWNLRQNFCLNDIIVDIYGNVMNFSSL